MIYPPQKRKKIEKIKKNALFNKKNLVNSKKSCTFAVAKAY